MARAGRPAGQRGARAAQSAAGRLLASSDQAETGRELWPEISPVRGGANRPCHVIVK